VKHNRKTLKYVAFVARADISFLIHEGVHHAIVQWLCLLCTSQPDWGRCWV